MENKMLRYVKENRINDYFLNIAINEIKIAHRVAEYLQPDQCFKGKNLDNDTMNKLLTNNSSAFNSILYELNINPDCKEYIDFGELVEVLRKEYLENKASEKEKRIFELTKELEELKNTK